MNRCCPSLSISNSDRGRLISHHCLLAASLIWFFANSLVSAAEPLIVESALLRLTQQVDVPARAQGVISEIHVAEGDSVGQGTLLAQMDDTEVRLLGGRAAIELQLNKEKVNNDVAIRSAQRALVFNKSEFERLERVRRDTPGSISASELEERRFRAEQAELDLEKAQHERRQDELSADLKAKELELSQYNIEVRKILAPINGVVVEVLRQPGEWVEPGEKVLRIVRMDRLRVEGMVHARNLPPDLRGAPVTIAMELPGKGETTFAGKVVFVSPEISPVNGQVRVWAEVENKDGLLKPGLRPRMTIVPGTVEQSASASAGLDRQTAQERARE
jgi:macrolide-specific efflux system membrane fusion protein